MSFKNQPNFYFILKVSPQAKTEEIKKAYIRMAQTYHPDKNRGNRLAEKKFQQINEAWQVLKDPKKRKQFDENLERAKKRRQSAPVSPQPVKQPPVRSEKPINLEVPLTVSLEDLCQSRPKTIYYFRPVDGKKTKSSFKVQIPPGAGLRSQLRFKGEGGAEGKEIFGDLYVRIQIEDHQLFQLVQDSRDIILEHPIPFVFAIQGGPLKVPSPYGLVALDLNPPLKHKQLLKVPGYGRPKNLKRGRGDLFVKLFVDYPEKEGLKIQSQLEKMPFEKQKIYVEKFKNRSFIYPRVLKFQKKVQELKRKSV